MREIEYEPRNLREVLVDLKDSSEVAVDLAYSAILFENRDLAEAVLDLEVRVDYLRYHARIALMLAAKRADQAERLVGIFQVVESAVAITSAAGDIARVIVDDVGLPAEFRSAFPESQEDLLRAEVAADSAMAGRTLADLAFDVDTGVRLIAVRRGDEWLFDPDGDTELLGGDVVFGRGPAAGVETIYERATGGPMPDDDDPSSDVADLDRAAETVVELRDVSELAVSLAYSAVLFADEALAHEVSSLEEASDSMTDDLEGWLLDAGQRLEDPQALRGLFHLGVASEAIADAALDVAEVVLRDIEVHPVFAQAVLESDEIVTSVTVQPDSELDGHSVGDLRRDVDAGMTPIALRRDRRWSPDPDPETTLEPDDVLVVRGPRDGEGRLRSLAGER